MRKIDISQHARVRPAQPRLQLDRGNGGQERDAARTDEHRASTAGDGARHGPQAQRERKPRNGQNRVDAKAQLRRPSGAPPHGPGEPRGRRNQRDCGGNRGGAGTEGTSLQHGNEREAEACDEEFGAEIVKRSLARHGDAVDTQATIAAVEAVAHCGWRRRVQWSQQE